MFNPQLYRASPPVAGNTKQLTEKSINILVLCVPLKYKPSLRDKMELGQRLALQRSGTKQTMLICMTFKART